MLTRNQSCQWGRPEFFRRSAVGRDAARPGSRSPAFRERSGLAPGATAPRVATTPPCPPQEPFPNVPADASPCGHDDSQESPSGPPRQQAHSPWDRQAVGFMMRGRSTCQMHLNPKLPSDIGAKVGDRSGGARHIDPWGIRRSRWCSRLMRLGREGPWRLIPVGRLSPQGG